MAPSTPQEALEEAMKIQEGQCGLCSHFGEHSGETPELEQIRRKKDAPVEIKKECGHPVHSSLKLMVTPISGCQAFEPARVM